jgi:hypothetical protein
MNYSVYIGIASVLFTGGYKIIAEPLVRDTAREVAIDVADSVVRAERTHSDSSDQKLYTHLKVIHNYMQLQDRSLFEKAKSLEDM